MSLWAFRFLLWFICILYVQPQNRFPFMWHWHIADIVAIVAIVLHLLSVFTEKRKLIRLGPATIMSLLLLAGALVSQYLGPLKGTTEWNTTVDALAKAAIVAILVEATADTVQRVWAVQATLLLATLWWIKGGVRLSASGATYAGDRIMGAAVSLIENPNGFAHFMSTIIPLHIYFFMRSEVRWLRWLFVGLALASVFIILQTGSRTGVVILFAMGVAMLPRFARRHKAALLIAAVGVAILLGAVSAGNIERFRTIRRSVSAFAFPGAGERAPQNPDEQSAQDRAMKNRHAWRLINRYPLFGIGIDPDDDLIPHELRMARGRVHCEILMAGLQMGYLGMGLYLAFVTGTYLHGKRVQKATENWWPDVSTLAWAFKTQVVVFVVGGLFGPGAWNYPFMIMAASASALWLNLKPSAPPLANRIAPWTAA